MTPEDQLNREGHSSAKGKPYTTKIVQWIRWRYQIPPATLKKPEELTVQQVARQFGVSAGVVYPLRGNLSRLRLLAHIHANQSTQNPLLILQMAIQRAEALFFLYGLTVLPSISHP